MVVGGRTCVGHHIFRLMLSVLVYFLMCERLTCYFVSSNHLFLGRALFCVVPCSYLCVANSFVWSRVMCWSHLVLLASCSGLCLSHLTLVGSMFLCGSGPGDNARCFVRPFAPLFINITITAITITTTNTITIITITTTTKIIIIIITIVIIVVTIVIANASRPRCLETQGCGYMPKPSSPPRPPPPRTTTTTRRFLRKTSKLLRNIWDIPNTTETQQDIQNIQTNIPKTNTYQNYQKQTQIK